MKAGTKIKTREGTFLITIDVNSDFRVLRLDDAILSIDVRKSADDCYKHLEELYGNDGLQILEESE